MSHLDLQMKLEGIILADSFSISKDAEAKANGETIKLLVDWDFSAITIEQGLAKAKSQVRIAWQNANRTNFDSYEDQQHLGTIAVAIAGNKMAVDVEKAAAGKYAAGSLMDKVKLISNVMGLPYTAVADMVAQKESVDVSEVIQAIDAYKADQVEDDS